MGNYNLRVTLVNPKRIEHGTSHMMCNYLRRSKDCVLVGGLNETGFFIVY